jgi:hypothetical protein
MIVTSEFQLYFIFVASAIIGGAWLLTILLTQWGKKRILIQMRTIAKDDARRDEEFGLEYFDSL